MNPTLTLSVALVDFTFHLTHLREQNVFDYMCGVPCLVVENLAAVLCSICRSVHLRCYEWEFARES